MNRILLLAIAIVTMAGAAMADARTPRANATLAKHATQMRKAASSNGRHWHQALGADQNEQSPEPDGVLPKTGKWGTLYTPEGEEWLYTSDYVKEVTNYVPAEENGGFELIEYSIVGATFTIFNQDMAQIAQFEVTLPEQDENTDPGKKETSINVIELSPLVTRKFFNVSDAYELMVYVHATTEDNTGHSYTMVYSVNDPSKGTFLVTTIEGNHVGGINLPKDQFDETFTLVFMREEFVEAEPNDDEYEYGQYLMHFDIYHEASWYDSMYPDAEFSMYEPTLLHTFTVDYKYFSGAGDYALPILLSQQDNRMVYALPRYEKEFFVSFQDGMADGTYADFMDYLMNPIVTPDNNFIIDLYDYKFDKVGTTSIPMASKEGFLWSFPGLGSLTGNDDVLYGYDGSASDKPFYIIGFENYVTSSDEFWTDFAVYDYEGNNVGTIIEDVADYITLSDVEGEDAQYCFYKVTETTSDFLMVDVPSGVVKATIPTMVNGASISTDIDRVKIGDQVKYLSSMTTADTDAEGNALHPIAWFKANGALEKIEKINLGQNVAMAQPYINAEAINPYIFNTDSQLEYMFLVKVFRQTGMSGSDEYLRIYSQDNNVLLNVGADVEGMPLNSIFMMNLGTPKAKLVVTYYANDEFKVSYYQLPLAKYAGGSGTASDPFQIANEGDLMSIDLCPTSHFIIVEDIDFKGYEWSGNSSYFSGSIDGQGHVISNVSLNGGGIFNNVVDGAIIKNFSLVNAKTTGSAFIASNVLGTKLSETDSKPSQIENVHVYNSEASAEESFGGIVNHASNYVNISGCSVNNVNINCTDGIAGGIVAISGPGNVVTACYASGELEAEIAGGIVGMSTNADTNVSNCHSSMNVCGALTSGGIIGQSARTTVTNCLVDGEITSTGATYSEYNHTSTQANAGGIVGWLNTYFENAHSPNMVVENCIVASPIVEAASGVDFSIAHRIVGSTSQERLEPDPDGNLNPDGSYVLVLGAEETHIGNNYVLGNLKAGNEEMNTGAANTLEGKSTTYGDELVATLSWPIGTNIASPWQQEQSAFSLFYETEVRGLVADQESVDIYGDKPATVTFIILGNHSADDIEIGLDNEEVANIASIMRDGNTAVIEIEYVSKGTATVTASYGAYQAVCSVNAAGESSGIQAVGADEKAAMQYVNGQVIADGSQISLYDMGGRCVATGANVIDTHSLANGVYIARTSAGHTLKIAVR